MIFSVSDLVWPPVTQTVSLPWRKLRTCVTKLGHFHFCSPIRFDRLETLRYKSVQTRFAMPRRILIADDYEDNRELLRLILVNADYEVCEARDGRECLAMVKEQPPDLIMIDLSMPVLDGWRVFQELKADERTSGIPCIAVTAYAEFDRNRALNAGFDDYLSKPFHTEELLKIVKQALSRHAVSVSVAKARGD
jgi:two-component system, cell cycle response regulator DivK